MSSWSQILAIIIVALLAWFLYRYVSHNPQQFSSENLSKGFRTLGLLALVLIVVVGFLIMMSRS